MVGPVFVYYELHNYYQNHRLYTNSISYPQLGGSLLSVSDVWLKIIVDFWGMHTYRNQWWPLCKYLDHRGRLEFLSCRQPLWNGGLHSFQRYILYTGPKWKQYFYDDNRWYSLAQRYGKIQYAWPFSHVVEHHRPTSHELDANCHSSQFQKIMGQNKQWFASRQLHSYGQQQYLISYCRLHRQQFWRRQIFRLKHL